MTTSDDFFLSTMTTIPGFPAYAVTVDGRVFSRRVYGSKNRTLGPPWEMKPKRHKQWLRPYVDLFADTGRPQRFFIHRLVLMTFVGPCPNGQECLHYDDDRENNYLGNLRYGTRKQNGDDARRNKVYTGKNTPKGEQHRLARSTANDVREMRRLAATGMMHKDIAVIFGRAQQHVSKIIRCEIWKSV